MFTLLLVYFVFLLVLRLGIWVEVDVDKITVLGPLPPPRFFHSTHNSFFNTSDSYLKSARAKSWFRSCLAV